MEKNDENNLKAIKKQYAQYLTNPKQSFWEVFWQKKEVSEPENRLSI